MFELDSRDIEHSDDFHTGYNENGKKGAWATVVGWDKLLLVFAAISLLSALAALFVLLTPLLGTVFGFMGLRYAEWSGWQAWIAGGELGLIIAAALGLIAILFALLARYRLRRDYSVYVEAGCPQCHEYELIRVRRNRRDRALGKLGLPVRRYSCRNCTWHGVRLAGYRYSTPNEESEAFMVDQFEDEMVDSQPETVEEFVPMVEVEADVETGTQALDDGLESTQIDTSTLLAVEWPEISEMATNESRDIEEELDSPTYIEETTGMANLNGSEPPVQQPADELDQNTGQEFDEVQTEDQEAEAGIDSEAEDDDFARLCFEVAQSKK